MAQAADPYIVALRLLAGRDYSTASLRDRLARRGYCHDVAAGVVARLERDGLLNDRRYAERFVAQNRASGRFVGYRLRQELRRRGISAELAAVVMADEPDAQPEVELARELVARRYAGFDPASADERERRRIAGFLQRRGFGSETVRAVLDRRNLFD